jgi:predicted porin
VYSLTDMKSGGSTAVLSTWEGGVTYWLTPAVSVLGGYAYSKLNEDRWGQYMLSANYSLSKQTDLYALLNYEHVHGENVRAHAVHRNAFERRQPDHRQPGHPASVLTHRCQGFLAKCFSTCEN